MKSQKTINSVIHNQLLGVQSEEDHIHLQSWLDSAVENKEKYRQLLDDTGIVDRCRAYVEIDEKRAWEQFRRKHSTVRRLRWNTIVRYAAIFILPFIGIATWLWVLHTDNIKPVVSHETRVAMIRSERMGKQKATLVLTNGERMELHSASSMPMLNTTQTVPVATFSEVQPNEVLAENDNQLETHRDSEFWMTFEDGTRVHLNYDTTLKYPSHFSTTTRTVYLDGEAYFEVAKDSNKRPFKVVTKDGVIQQYGTSFNVNTQSELDTKVVLVEGSISVAPNQGKELKMKPGELAVFQGQVQGARISKVDVEPYIAWNKGRFVFDNCSLEALMDVLSGWYDREVVFESDDMRYMHFTGDMDRYESIIPLAKAIQRVTGLEVEVTEKNILLKNYNTNH